MDDEAKKLLLRTEENTDKIPCTIEKPKKPGRTFIDYIVLGIGVAGILSVIDLLKNWFGG